MTPQQKSTKPEVSARASELAQASGVDTAKVEGTGADGRVTYADVEKYLAEHQEK